MIAKDAHPGTRIRWTKGTRTFEGVIEGWQNTAESGMVRVRNDEGHTMLVGVNQECEVVE